MSSASAPRRNSYQRLVTENADLINRVADQWNAIIAQGRKPDMPERLEMADQLRMNDARFYELRRHYPDIFHPLPQQTAETFLKSPAPAKRQRPSLPAFSHMAKEPAR